MIWGWCLRLTEWSQRSRKDALASKGCCVPCEKRWTRTGYSLCVAGGPRQPLRLLQYEDRSRNVIRRALYFVRRQSQELRSAVRKFQRQTWAAGMVSVGATSHHTTHKISHCRFHPREHGPATPWVQAIRLRESPPARQMPARRRGLTAWKEDTRRPYTLIQLCTPSVNAEIKASATQTGSAARWSCDKQAAAGGFGRAGIWVSSLLVKPCCRSKVHNPRVTVPPGRGLARRWVLSLNGWPMLQSL